MTLAIMPIFELLTRRRDSLAAKVGEHTALETFLKYLGDGVIVGHHIGHDVETFNAGYERHFGFRLQNPSLDTMSLTLHLERDGAFAGRPPIQEYSHDALCVLFDIVPHDRHTAPGDAFMTALVFQRLLRLASKQRRNTLSLLLEPFDP
jgi:DNA polymerase III subunit epsilon